MREAQQRGRAKLLARLNYDETTSTCSCCFTLHQAKPIRMDTILGAHDVGGLLLIKDCLESPGAFVMLQALKLALSLSYRVALVSVAQGAQHYQPLLRKLGINLHAVTSSGQLVFLDALHSVAELTGGQAAPGISLQGLFYQVAELAASNSSSQPLCLVVDDLSVSTRQSTP